MILGSFASRNPLASLGGSREMKLMIAYEFPLVLAVLVPVIQANSIRLGDLLSGAPAAAGARRPAYWRSGWWPSTCMQAKLTIVPFDMPEAETELSGGVFIEYSGPPLAMFKLTRAMMLFTVPVFLVVAVFRGLVVDWAGMGAKTDFRLSLVWFLLVAVTIVLRNTTPRVRTDQAVRFFWGPVSRGRAALQPVVLAWTGW